MKLAGDCDVFFPMSNGRTRPLNLSAGWCLCKRNKNTNKRRVRPLSGPERSVALMGALKLLFFLSIVLGELLKTWEKEASARKGGQHSLLI